MMNISGQFVHLRIKVFFLLLGEEAPLDVVSTEV